MRLQGNGNVGNLNKEIQVRKYEQIEKVDKIWQLLAMLKVVASSPAVHRVK